MSETDDRNPEDEVNPALNIAVQQSSQTHLAQILRANMSGTFPFGVNGTAVPPTLDTTNTHEGTDPVKSASAAPAHDMGSARLQSWTVPPNHQSALLQQVDGARVSGIQTGPVTADVISRDQERVRVSERAMAAAAAAPIGAAAQYDAHNRLSLYMQRQMEAARNGAGHRNSVSAIGGAAQGMAQGAGRTIGRPGLRPGVPPPQYMVPSTRAPIQQYAQKRPAPYLHHQMEAAQSAAAAWKYQRLNPGAASNSFPRPPGNVPKLKTGFGAKSPTFVNIVENAAAFFEGKPRPEDAVDKERSQERYQFNVDMLEEIFDGPLPRAQNNNTDNNSAKAAGVARAKEGVGNTARETAIHEDVARRLGEKMLSRTHEERMAEFDVLLARYRDLENGQTFAEKGSMKIFQKLERAADASDVVKVREEYEQGNDVKFVEAPAPIEKKAVDCSLPPLRAWLQARIAQFP